MEITDRYKQLFYLMFQIIAYIQNVSSQINELIVLIIEILCYQMALRMMAYIILFNAHFHLFYNFELSNIR